MKLAEALILRSDLQKRIEQIKEQLYRNAKVQENDTPAEEPRELLEEFQRLTIQLERIIKKINHTNATVRIKKEQTIAEALAEREMIGLRHRVLTDLIQHASVKQDRYTRTEVKFYPTVNIANLQREADQLAKQYRELDTKIQEYNWKTDLIE